MANKINEGKEFLLELKRTKVNQKNCEKDWLNAIQVFNKKLLHKDIFEIEEELNKQYVAEMRKIERNLKKIQQNVHEFKIELSKDPISQKINKIQSLMETTESLIAGLKEEQRVVFTEILENEKSCEKEIQLLNTRIEILQAPTIKSTKNTKNVKTVSYSKNNETLPAAVLTFQRFLDAKGVTGGWDDSDHATFLKLVKRSKGPSEQVCEYIHNAMPFRTLQDIINHFDWHKRFSDLKRDKALAIANWKQEKKETNKQKTPVTVNEVAVPVEVDQATLIQREIKRKQVAEWKMVKLKEEEMKKQKDLAEEERRHQMKLQRQEKQQKHNEEILQKLKQKREIEQREQWSREMEEQWISETKRKQALQDVKKFQARDEMAVKHKLRMKKLKEKEAEIQKEKLERTKEKVFAPRNKNRLYEFTEAWNQRKNATPESNTALNVNRIPHRAVPGWRQTS